MPETSVLQAPSYHRQNLLDLLRQAVGEQDHARAAVAAVTLLAAQVSPVLPYLLLYLSPGSFIITCLHCRMPSIFQVLKRCLGLWKSNTSQK